jgi:pimeloyl-ACP methyl ester carboxylesterase
MLRDIIAINNLGIEVLESEGSGSPIFFFHSNSSAANSFEHILCSEMGRRRKMVALSFPGHGNSDCAVDPEDTYYIEGLGKIAADVVQSYGSKKYWLVGHSLGGHAILESLPAFKNASGLMLISSPPLTLADLGRAFKPDPSLGALFKGDITDAEVERLASCFIDPTNAPAWQLIRDNIKKTDPRFRPALGASLGASRMRNEIEALHKSHIPIAMVMGKEDQFLNLDYVKGYRGPQLWREKVLIIEECGHVPHLEMPEMFGALLEGFLQETEYGNIIPDAGDRRHAKSLSNRLPASKTMKVE